MKRNSWVRLAALICLIALPLMATGCSLFKAKEEPNNIDPPQQEDASANTGQSGSGAVQQQGTAAGSGQQNNTNVTLYFKDKNGYVVPLSMHLPDTKSIAQESLAYMVQNGPEQANLPDGYSALLPKGTKVVSMSINNGQAVVDFSKEFENYKKDDERKLLEAVTWALTGWDNVKQVRLWVNGHALAEMPKAGTPLDEPLTRKMGINLENVAGVELSQAMPVTLYFQNNDGYLVPVTRMVPYDSDVAKAALEQLIKGPEQPSPLKAVMLPSAKVLHLNEGDKMLTVDFNKQILSANQKLPAETVDAVVMSLSDNTGDNKVQIMVNGSVKQNGQDSQNYSVPVNRPAHINPVKS